jgi:hypothetical protein
MLETPPSDKPEAGDVPETADLPQKSADLWRARITACKNLRKTLLQDWAINIDYRRGKQFDTDTDQDRISVNEDWPLTKAKHASLFSQVPAVTITSDKKQFKPITPLFAKALNMRLSKAKVDVMMDEVMPDVINAAGIGACYVGYDSRTVPKQVGTSMAQPQPQIPGQPPAPPQPPQPVDLTQFKPQEIALAVKQGMLKVDTINQVVDKRFYCKRISPGDLLWDIAFEGSDFDDSDWIGQSGRMSWAEGKHAFKLKDADKTKVAKGDDRTLMEQMSPDYRQQHEAQNDNINYNEIYYWAYRDDPDEKYFTKIKRIVFVDGLEDPVLDEDWDGQKFNEDGTYVGSCKFPIRVLTLTYVSDEAIPPSDTAIGRPQVDELVRSRTQMVLQRDRSQPLRHYDVNRIDPAIADQLMRGTFQGFIPVNGNGANAIGEVARANYPREDFEFDRVAKADLQEMWQIGSNQMGAFAPGENSAAESKIVQTNFQTRTGQERARVAKMFISVAEVMAGLMALYDDFKDLLDEQEVASLMQVWGERKEVAFSFTIRPDSTVLLDSEQRIQRLLRVLNMVGKSGYVNPQPIIEEIITLSGLNPSEIVSPPKPKEPEPANLSLRITGAQDIMNPLMLAFLIKSGQAPSPTELDAAKALLIGAGQPPTPPQASQGPGGPGGPPPPPNGQGGAPGGITEASVADWNTPPRVTKRPMEMNG